jgi:predicted transcriptional regulator
VRIEVRAPGVKTRRHEMGLTQRQLSRMVGVTQNYIAAVEAGTRHAGPNLKQSLMDALKASFDDLFEVVLVEPRGREWQLHRRLSSGGS